MKIGRLFDQLRRVDQDLNLSLSDVGIENKAVSGLAAIILPDDMTVKRAHTFCAKALTAFGPDLDVEIRKVVKSAKNKVIEKALADDMEIKSAKTSGVKRSRKSR